MASLTVADSSRRLLESESPCYRLLDLLSLEGVDVITSFSHTSDTLSKLNPFQDIAVRILVWGGGFRRANVERGISYVEMYRGKCYYFVRGRGGVRAKLAYHEHEWGWRSRLLELMPEKPRPVVVIDLSLLLEHVHPTEYLSLRRQIAASLSVVRKYLWDRHLVVTGARPGVAEWLSALLGRALARITCLTLYEHLASEGYKYPVLLDPSAEEPLSPRDVLEADVFILGGIVDRIPRRGLTARIREAVEGLVKPRRIEFRGSLVGVPNRLNMLVESLLLARYKLGGSIEDAIRMVMSPRDARLRAYVEIARYAARKGTKKVDWSFYEQLKEWLPLRPIDFIRAARMAGVEVVGVQQDQSSSRSQR